MSQEIKKYCEFPMCDRVEERNGFCFLHAKHFGGPKPQAKMTAIPKQSAKKKSQLEAEKPNRDAKEQWFALIRARLVGVCQCGCGQSSSKNDDVNFRSSCCHLFPKKDFESVRYHRLNYVERNFWDGCHTNMDNQSMDKWPNMADWEDMKAKFYLLSPLLTDKERSTKFYTHLERLVNEN